jgi:hypothetical protein
MPEHQENIPMSKKARGRGPLSVTAQQALCHFLALDNERSLRRLRRYYEEIGVPYPPSFATLAAWCRRDNWVGAAAAHDEEVGAALRLRLRETAVQQRFDKVQSLEKAAQLCLDVAEKTIRGVTPATASDIKALVTSAIDCLKLCEVLTGGVSNREDRGDGIAAEALLILQQIEQEKRGRAKPVAAATGGAFREESSAEAPQCLRTSLVGEPAIRQQHVAG